MARRIRRTITSLARTVNNDVTNLTATPSAASIALTWAVPSAPSGTIQGYSVYLNGVKNNNVVIAGLSYTINSLAASTTYTVLVTTLVNGAESTGVGRSVTTTASNTTTINVSTASQLTTALASAVAGQTIQLADGTYSGKFVLRNCNGTNSQPIIIQGSRNAIINAGTTSSGYALYIDGCSYIQVKGIQITGAQKSIVFDETNYSVIDGLACHDCGGESILLRNFSSDNIVKNCEVYNTGLVSPGFGEGIYIGLAYSNWNSTQSRTGGAPDTSDRNQILDNTIHDTAAECIDIKEGTSNGIIRGNTFDGTNMSGSNYADSWIDVKGCGYLIENNSGTNALLDGFQTHTQPAGITTGSNNTFRNNTLAVNAAGYGISINTGGSGNVVYTSNTVSGAVKGLTNITPTAG